MHVTRWVRHLLTGLVLAMGLTNIASALLSHNMARNEVLHALLPVDVTQASRSVALIAGFGLILVGRGLWRGKRVAWLLTLGLLVLSAVVHLVKGLDWEEATGALLVAAILLGDYGQFTRRSDPPTLRRVPLFMLAGIVAIVLYTLAGFWLLHAFQPFSPSLIVQELFAHLLWSDGPYADITQGRAAWFLDSIDLLGFALTITTLWLLLRPVLPYPASIADRLRASELVRRYGTSSLAPFALTDDKQLYVSEKVEGVVAYRTVGGVAVVCGDPIAPSEQVGALAREFVDFCTEQDWQVCFYEVQPRYLENYTSLGYESVKIGEDAWIDLPSFSLKGSAMSDIRHAVNKIVRDGVTFCLLQPGNDNALWEQMQTIEEAWRAAQPGGELRFSIGRLPQQREPNARYTVALAADGATVLAFCSFLAIPAIDGLALDVMRRGPNVPNGTMEFLLARSLEQFRDASLRWVSLGLAPLANVDTAPDSLLARAIRAVSTNERVNSLYHYQSLFFFKKKFNPQWRGGYLVYSNQLALPAVLTAVMRVHAPAITFPSLIVATRRAAILRFLAFRRALEL